MALAAFRERGALSGSLPPDTAVWGLSSDALPVWRPRDRKTDRDPDALPVIDMVPVLKKPHYVRPGDSLRQASELDFPITVLQGWFVICGRNPG